MRDICWLACRGGGRLPAIKAVLDELVRGEEEESSGRRCVPGFVCGLCEGEGGRGGAVAGHGGGGGGSSGTVSSR